MYSLHTLHCGILCRSKILCSLQQKVSNPNNDTEHKDYQIGVSAFRGCTFITLDEGVDVGVQNGQLCSNVIKVQPLIAQGGKMCG